MLLLQMNYKRVKTCVVGNNMKIRVLVRCRYTPNVKRNVKIKCVVSGSGHLDIFCARTKLLNCLGQGEWQFCLVLANKHQYPDPLLVKKVKVVRCNFS